ncbi:glycosyltransferase [Anaeromyxobacter oryzae]|uniref:Glycosyltransferase 2-like domain-containing protein n=1 Tax=Anaeromyxobacter oryzae TaxID=2918170 RepID=A0ABN6MRS3_9BACT|nr:glycosyltransferase family 2 protein [Anaeromyxobacter oryzae]BDG03692.1 hypothetical protein AMOR_26880 [Anaeromyxobacter oryzae]
MRSGRGAAAVAAVPELAEERGPGADAAPRTSDAARAAAAPSPALYASIFAAWSLALAWFHPRLAACLAAAETPLEWCALAFFVAFTELAWLHGFFNVAVVLFAIRHRRRAAPPPPALPSAELPAVAVLYTTCNDFVEASARSCLEQDYPRFTVYLLDDSSDPAYRARVDAFAAGAPRRVRVVRRRDRRGFKAGNLNHALDGVAQEPVFALADADEILPPDFLRRLAPRLLADPSCGFVQANHACNPAAPGALARSLGVGIGIHWRWYQPLRNAYGFVMLLGHGALVRREAWVAAGGFPELVSEDLAFALRARERGWRGRFAEDVVCYEDFPETVRAFRIRHMKWTRGTCELLSREMGRVLRSRNIPIVEKLDVLFPTVNLPLSLLYFLFVIDANVVLTALFGQRAALTIALGGTELVVPTTVLGGRLQSLAGADLFAITLLTLFAPVLCFVLDLWRKPLTLVRFLGQSTAAYGTLGPLSAVGVVCYLLTGRAVFHVTADRGAPRAGLRPASVAARLRASAAALLAGSHPDHLAVQAFEVLCGVGFALSCLATFQISFLGLALGFLLLPVLHHVSWSSTWVRALVYVPFVFVVLGVALGGLSLLGLQTVLFGFGFHF